MRIQRQYIERVVQARDAEALLPLVQEAVRLEHATIPPYLCGYFSLKIGANEAVGRILRAIVMEEMLHMTLAANLLIALGGQPQLNRLDFVPAYPHQLPLGIGDSLTVRLRKCSIDQVRDVFMAIEKPENPIAIRNRVLLTAADSGPLAASGAAPAPEFDTIGLFYAHLTCKIEELGSEIFVGDPARQVVTRRWFPESDEMFIIRDVASARRALAVIVEQGEGTSVSPFETDGAPAHYYRFDEIVRGKSLIHRPDETPPFAYAGDPIALDAAGVWDMDDDPRVEKYLPGSRSRALAEIFASSYTALLNALHQAFNGQPRSLDHALGLMYELRFVAQQVLATPAQYTDPARTASRQTGLCFEHWPPLS